MGRILPGHPASCQRQRRSRQIRPQQRGRPPRHHAAQGGAMSESPAPPLFDARARRELYDRRVLVLDGVLDDDNGTLLATQLVTLAAEDPTAEIALWIHS